MRDMNANESARRRGFLLASLPLWLAGLALALWAWSLHREAPDCADAAIHCRGMSTDAQIAEEYGLQRMGGKAMVFMVRFERWAQAWLEGARLRALLSAACLAAALGLVLGAYRAPHEADDVERDSPGPTSHERIP